FVHHPAYTEIYTLSLHDALPIFPLAIILGIESTCDETSASICIDGKIYSNIIANQTVHEKFGGVVPELASRVHQQNIIPTVDARSEEHTSELQSRENLVCRLLLE